MPPLPSKLISTKNPSRARTPLRREELRSGELVLRQWRSLLFTAIATESAASFSASCSCCNLLSSQWSLSKSLVPPTVWRRLMERSGIPFLRFNFVRIVVTFSFSLFPLLELRIQEPEINISCCLRLLMLDSVFSVFVNESERFNLEFDGDSDLSVFVRDSDRLSLVFEDTSVFSALVSDSERFSLVFAKVESPPFSAFVKDSERFSLVFTADASCLSALVNDSERFNFTLAAQPPSFSDFVTDSVRPSPGSCDVSVFSVFVTESVLLGLATAVTSFGAVFELPEHASSSLPCFSQFFPLHRDFWWG